MTLGRLIALLSERPADQSVEFDFGGLTPCHLHSWRGSYSELAIDFCDPYQRDEEHFKTVGELLTALRSAVGATYQGYKGGDFVMTTDTRLWVDHYGQGGHTGIAAVSGDDYHTIIDTCIQEF